MTPVKMAVVGRAGDGIAAAIVPAAGWQASRSAGCASVRVEARAAENGGGTRQPSRSFSAFCSVSIVSPPESHFAVLECNQPMVGDCNPVCVAPQILQHIIRASKGLLRIDNPLLTPELPQERAKALRFMQ